MSRQVQAAIVCDWLTELGGAEKVVLAMHEMYPDAPIYTSQFRPRRAKWFVGLDVRTGWMNILPAGIRRFVPFLRALYFSHLDLSEYDLVISITSAESKGVKCRADATHISYLQGPPTQYYWGLYEQYLRKPGFGKLDFIVRFFFRILVGPLRQNDYKTAQKPDILVAISRYAAAEIKKYYDREADVIAPPVDTKNFPLVNEKQDYFITTARQQNWKRLDVVIRACIKTGSKLKLVGMGPEHKQLISLATDHKNIEFLGLISDPSKIADLVGSAKGFIQASLEPFGIAPVEALSAGTPVIAYAQGGALDYVVDGKNGLLFDKQNVSSLAAVIKRFDKTKLDYRSVSRSAAKFSEANFKKSMMALVDKCLKK